MAAMGIVMTYSIQDASRPADAWMKGHVIKDLDRQLNALLAVKSSRNIQWWTKNSCVFIVRLKGETLKPLYIAPGMQSDLTPRISRWCREARGDHCPSARVLLGVVKPQDILLGLIIQGQNEFESSHHIPLETNVCIVHQHMQKCRHKAHWVFCPGRRPRTLHKSAGVRIRVLPAPRLFSWTSLQRRRSPQIFIIDSGPTDAEPPRRIWLRPIRIPLEQCLHSPVTSTLRTSPASLLEVQRHDPSQSTRHDHV